MSASTVCRHLLAGIALLVPPLAAHGFWMPGTGPCAWMADGLLGGTGNRGYGGVAPYYYPPPPHYPPPLQQPPAWQPVLPAREQPQAPMGSNGSVSTTQ